MFVLKNFELEVIRVGDVDKIVMSEEPVRGDGPLGFWVFEETDV